jgi:8-oxo-dGTP pyrophosphatase MutT (NUDIX family)
MRGVSSRFERTGSETVYEGGFVAVRRDTFRHEDGEEVQREIVGHPGAVGVVVLDGDDLWLVRQPREAVGTPDLLELPAGKLDEEGESPLDTAKRELAEEIGKRAEHWEPLGSFFTSPGFTDEEVHLFLATGISDVDERPEVAEDERIDAEVRPLADLDAILAETKDSKTLIGLHALKARLA